MRRLRAVAGPSLDGVRMKVATTDERGVVGAGTLLTFAEPRPGRVIGRYAGGRIVRGVLAGRRRGRRLTFRFVQVEAGVGVHAGRSDCEIGGSGTGRLRVVERFSWTTRPGSGTNVFEQV